MSSNFLPLGNKYGFEFMQWCDGASPHIKSLACSDLIKDALFDAFCAGAEGRAHDKYGAPKHFGKWCRHKWEPFDPFVDVCDKCGWSRKKSIID